MATARGRIHAPLGATRRPMSVKLNQKLAGTVDDRDTRHLHWLARQMGADLLDALIINTGPQAYRRPDGIGVVPLGLLAP